MLFRSTERLLRRVGPSFPLLEGEGLEEHFTRLAGLDFDKGFGDCDNPQMHAMATQAAQRALPGAIDSDGVVDEEQILQEDIALIEQALELGLRSEERFFGITPEGISSQVSPLIQGEDDSIDAQALVLALGADPANVADEQSHRERPRG